MKRTFYLLLFLLIYGQIIMAQETFPVNGITNKNQVVYAFVNAKVFIDFETVLEHGTVLVQDGKIIDVGTNISIPKGALEYNLEGKFLYPSFIDLNTSYGINNSAKFKGGGRAHQPQIEKKTPNAFGWNQAIKPEVDAAAVFKADDKEAKNFRDLGFGAVLTFSHDGIARGSSALVSLGEGKENSLIIAPEVAAHYSFSKGSSKQTYPSSLMGRIALLRQTYLDAEWYRKDKKREEQNLSLEAWNDLQDLPQIFDAGNKLNILRADKIGDEFGVQYVIYGATDGYQRIDELKKTDAAFVITLNFPKPYDVNDPYEADNVSLAQMKHWELAPTNPGAFESNGIIFALTARGLKDKKVFWKNLRKAIANGLSEKEALKSLTYTPAQLINASDKVGSIKKGMLASFIITSGNIFDKKSTIYENWIQGKQYIINDIKQLDLRGQYELTYGKQVLKLDIKGEKHSINAKVFFNDTAFVKAKTLVSGKQITIVFKESKDKKAGSVRLNGIITEEDWKGRGQIPNGNWIDWNVKKVAAFKPEKKEKKKEALPIIGVVTYPNMAYGWKEKPKAEAVLIKNATIWTNEEEGVLKATDLIISGGKIQALGKDLKAPAGGTTIDAAGMHISAGIVDEHSHATISGGGNESGQAISAEVSIGDVINSDNINIYRQLAGGVTSAQILHGSANPIGGQSGIIKFRWGLSPEELKIKDADGFIKFALGENVKQSNWGDDKKVRYPQSRMGVEQLFYNAFIRAKEYEQEWKNYNNLSAKEKGRSSAPRRDLELDVLLEIINAKRFITCHSYTQAEINMLMHVADSMGFKINTFTHILEGYKVAGKMKAHGVAASTFSDWWAYKFEVNDAIPYNGALLHEVGVLTAFNSDDSEMARRLNQEAAKAIKYGGVSQEEALKFVTLNPAKMLHLDHRIGSIKVGKDADVVLWTANPLSVYAKVVKTYVDGICYYDAKRDVLMREEIKTERARLIQKMIKAKKDGEGSQPADFKKSKEFKCGIE
ncbi:MAG TPA: amidohydrolase [Flavobacteriales bacterium]|nr:amidohydrolase [Flavobacteriales bacterium]